MGRTIGSVLKILIPLVLAIVLVYYAFAKVDFQDFLAKSAETNYTWVIVSIVIALLSYVVRAYRWNLMLGPMGYKVTTFRTSLAVLVGYLANLAFPRLGEITRCGILKRNDDVPVTVSIGTVISERIIDALTLLTLFGASFLIEFDLINSFIRSTLSEYDISYQKFIYAGVGLVVVGIIIAIVFLNQSSTRLVKFREWAKELYAGILSVSRLQNFPGFVLSTILLWVMYYLMSYVVIFSLEETSGLDIIAGFMLLVTGGIAIALPVQGGIGTYHTMVTAMLMLYGVDRTTGLFLATLLHTSQVFGIVVFGAISLLITFFISRKKASEPGQQENNKSGASDPA